MIDGEPERVHLHAVARVPERIRNEVVFAKREFALEASSQQYRHTSGQIWKVVGGHFCPPAAHLGLALQAVPGIRTVLPGHRDTLAESAQTKFRMSLHAPTKLERPHV